MSITSIHYLHTKISTVVDIMWDRSRRPEGVNGSRSKFLLKFKPSAYIPKPPQTLEPEPARIAMNKLSQSKRPESQSGSKERQFAELNCRDRSDRSFPDSSKINLQTMNLEQTTFKSNETWRIPSQLSREHIPKRSFPED